MSFAGWNQAAASQTATPKSESKSRGSLLAVSAAGMFALMWLSRRIFPDPHRLPQDFNERLHAVAPSLAVYAAALFCTFATAFLYKDWESAVAAKKADEAREQPPVRAKLSEPTAALLRTAYILAGTATMCVPYIFVLWPARARTISLTAVAGFAAVVVLGLLIKHYGQQTHFVRGMDDVGRQREPWTISTPVLVGSALAFLIAGSFGVHFAAKHFTPAHERGIVEIGIGLMACVFGLFVEILDTKNPVEPAQSLLGAEAEDHPS